MRDLASLEVWFVTGSQEMYGPDTLAAVAADARDVVAALDVAPSIPVRVVARPVVTDAADIRAEVPGRSTPIRRVSGSSPVMHTFSPAKMWIAGLTALQRPLLDLSDTQYHDRTVGLYRHGLHDLTVPAYGDPLRESSVHGGTDAPRTDGGRRPLDGLRG